MAVFFREGSSRLVSEAGLRYALHNRDLLSNLWAFHVARLRPVDTLGWRKKPWWQPPVVSGPVTTLSLLRGRSMRARRHRTA